MTLVRRAHQHWFLGRTAYNRQGAARTATTNRGWGAKRAIGWVGGGGRFWIHSGIYMGVLLFRGAAWGKQSRLIPRRRRRRRSGIMYIEWDGMGIPLFLSGPVGGGRCMSGGGWWWQASGVPERNKQVKHKHLVHHDC
ncbi:hypothetical protein QBC39DRAFT_53243 [Podospora conica]|nr:hypothetical protein QBC39DRAFT_53243 [Schizothecium conicum]